MLAAVSCAIHHPPKQRALIYNQTGSLSIHGCRLPWRLTNDSNTLVTHLAPACDGTAQDVQWHSLCSRAATRRREPGNQRNLYEMCLSASLPNRTCSYSTRSLNRAGIS